MKNILTKKTDSFTAKKLDWTKVQFDMKEKLVSDIYQSWLKKIMSKSKHKSPMARSQKCEWSMKKENGF